MKSFLTLFLLFLGAVIANAQLVSLEEVEALMSQAEDQMTKEIEAGVEISDRQREKSKQWIQKGIQSHEKGEFQKAIKHYQKALKFEPTSYLAYYEMGFSYSILGEHKKALEAGVKARTIDPEAEDAYVVVANVLDNLGFNGKALEQYQSLLERHPNSIMVHINMGVSLARAGKLQEASASFQRAIEIDPEHPSAYFQLASIAQNEGHEFDEEKYLKLFVKYGRNDSRLPMAEKRLETLKQHKINVNPDHPFPAIQMMEGMARALWKGDKFQETFPDKPGYEPSIEEELDVYGLILKLWKEKKEKNPELEYRLYDMLLDADQAGHFETMVYALSQAKLPGDVSRYFIDHPQEKADFFKWGREKGYLKEPSSKAAEEKSSEPVTLAQLAIGFLQNSEVEYNISPFPAGQKREFHQLESKRYRQSLVLTGEGKFEKEDVKDTIANLGAQDSDAVLRAFGYLFPKDQAWETYVKQLPRFNLQLKSNPIPEVFPGGLGEKSTTILFDRENKPWLAYWCVKSVYQNEPDFRRRVGGEADYSAPTVHEEEIAFTAATQDYMDSKSREYFKEAPFFEFLETVYRANAMEGFVLYEVVHKYYGVRLERLSLGQQAAFLNYFRTFACMPVTQ